MEDIFGYKNSSECSGWPSGFWFKRVKVRCYFNQGKRGKKTRSLWQERWWVQFWTCAVWGTYGIFKQRLLLSWIWSSGGKLNSDSDEEVTAKVMAEVMVMDEIAGESVQKENRRHFVERNPREYPCLRQRAQEKVFQEGKSNPKEWGHRNEEKYSNHFQWLHTSCRPDAVFDSCYL